MTTRVKTTRSRSADEVDTKGLPFLGSHRPFRIHNDTLIVRRQRRKGEEAGMKAGEGNGNVLNGGIVIADAGIIVRRYAEEYRCRCRPRKDFLGPRPQQVLVETAIVEARVVKHDD